MTAGWNAAAVCPDYGLRDRAVQHLHRGQFRQRHCFLGGRRHQCQRRQRHGGLGEAYLKFVNIGRLLKLPQNLLNLRVGQFELELPFTQARSIWISPYDIYTQANIGAVNSLLPLQQFVNNQFTIANAGKGVELSGGLHTGGYNYSIAFIDQNTSGVGQDANPGSPYVPQATGSNNGGLGVASDANFKDIYASFNYRFNLERDKESRNAIQAAGPTGPRDHTYLNLGSYYFYGRSVQRLSGATRRRHADRRHRARAVLSGRRQHDLQLSLLPAVQCPVHVRARLQPAAHRRQWRT